MAASTNTTRRGFVAGDPTVILIFGWYGASKRALRKYAEDYERLYPSTTCLSLPADPLRYWKPAAWRERALLPAVIDVEELISQVPEGKAPPKVLIHVLSNSGAMTLVDFAAAVRKRRARSPPGTKCAFVFDSSPAPMGIVLAIRATTATFQNPLTKYFMTFVIAIVFSLTAAARRAVGEAEPVAVAAKAINDPGLLPWTSVSTPRLYLYSPVDYVVPARMVEAHAMEARRKGYKVQMVNFGNSGHVSHAREYPEKYWGAVRAFWSTMLAQSTARL